MMQIFYGTPKTAQQQLLKAAATSFSKGEEHATRMTPQKGGGGNMAPAPVLHLTTSLRGDLGELKDTKIGTVHQETEQSKSKQTECTSGISNQQCKRGPTGTPQFEQQPWSIPYCLPSGPGIMELICMSWSEYEDWCKASNSSCTLSRSM